MRASVFAATAAVRERETEREGGKASSCLPLRRMRSESSMCEWFRRSPHLITWSVSGTLLATMRMPTLLRLGLLRGPFRKQEFGDHLSRRTPGFTFSFPILRRDRWAPPGSDHPPSRSHQPQHAVVPVPCPAGPTLRLNKTGSLRGVSLRQQSHISYPVCLGTILNSYGANFPPKTMPTLSDRYYDHRVYYGTTPAITVTSHVNTNVEPHD